MSRQLFILKWADSCLFQSEQTIIYSKVSRRLFILKWAVIFPSKTHKSKQKGNHKKALKTLNTWALVLTQIFSNLFNFFLPKQNSTFITSKLILNCLFCLVPANSTFFIRRHPLQMYNSAVGMPDKYFKLTDLFHQ